MKHFIFALSLLFFGFSATGQITDPSYKSKVMELMNIQMGQDLVMDEMVKNLMPMVAEDKRDEFKKDISVVMNKLMDKTADIYMEVSTKQEVDALLEFYNSPIGQQIREKLPLIMKKSMKMGQEFSTELMPIVQKYMK